MHEDILAKLEQRLGRLHARQRLGIETDHEAQIFGQGLTFFHLENWYSAHSIIRGALSCPVSTGAHAAMPNALSSDAMTSP